MSKTHSESSVPAAAELQGYLHTAIRAAQAAARIHQHNVGLELGIATKSSDIDLVTRVDGESEAAIRRVLLSSYPEHMVLGEEGGEEGDAPYRWVVDPLDGTLNYAHGFPFYCVSIALEIHGEIALGVVLDSVRNELFSAVRGGGAYLNGAPIAVSGESTLRRSMLATGFSYNSGSAAENVAIFSRMMSKCLAIRRPGAAALDLAYIACGRLDGFWELTLFPWDVAAGVLLIQEAGGQVTGPSGEPYRLGEGVLVGSNGLLQETLVQALELPDTAFAR